MCPSGLPEKIEPVNEKQRQLVAALASPDVDTVGVFGPTGTGKSFITCMYGIQAVKEGKFKRFIIARPIVDAYTGKVHSYLDLGGQAFLELAASYIYDLAGKYLDAGEIRRLMGEEKIVLADPSFIGGRTFEEALVFLDDAQFLPPQTIQEAMLRMGADSKLVVAGDPVFQTPADPNGAALAREILLGLDRTLVIDFGVFDIVRPGAKKAFHLALEARMRRRPLSEEERAIISMLLAHAPDAQIVTVVDLKSFKQKHGVKNVPDAIVIAKKGYLGRIIGKGGEKIRKIEEESKLSLRGVELDLDFKPIVSAIHPVGWIRKHVLRTEIVGGNLEVQVSGEEFGAFVGRNGSHVRFLDDVFRSMLGIGVKATSVERKEK